MDNQMLRLGIGLLGLILINILLGSINSLFSKDFDKTKFYKGFLKGFIVILSFFGTYGIGVINPDVITMNINDVDVNLVTAIHLTVLGAFIAYGKQVIEKLSTFVSLKK